MPPTNTLSLKRRAKQAARLALRRLSHRPVRAAAIAAELRSLGVRPGGVLLVHSSLSALGYVAGGPEAVVDALQEAVGPEGTLAQVTEGIQDEPWNHLLSLGCPGRASDYARRDEEHNAVLRRFLLLLTPRN